MDMSEEKSLEKNHPEGERETTGVEGVGGSGSVDTFAGKIQVKWVRVGQIVTGVGHERQRMRYESCDPFGQNKRESYDDGQRQPTPG